MNRATPRILAVGATGPGTLKIKWKDRSADRVDLSGWIATGGETLVRLRNADVFGNPKVSDYGTSVAWGDEDDDLRIDAVHLQEIAAEQRPFGARQAAEWQKGMGLSNNEAIATLCRAARRDPILMNAHYRPRKAGRPRKSA